ncbi:MAG: peroxiredoxin [Rhizobiales bacterium]|nr:peroxiredoxin [Hyphomicrobiales bacterium]NRB14453.1 peroxiredoxin [Hyphomicrobiales bacterium]
MIGVGEKLPEFKLVGVKPGFNNPEENGTSAFEDLTNGSFAGKWKIIYFYPKDFTFVCPTEIVAFAELNDDFDARDAVVIGGSTDNAFCKLAWRREHADLNKLNQWSFADNGGTFMDALGIRDKDENVALRATFIVDPDNIVQHLSVNPLSVGRNPTETLRILDAIQTGVNCGCNREVGGEVL